MSAVYFFWGTTYLGIETVNRTIPTALGAAIRFLVAGSRDVPALAAARRASGRRGSTGGPPRSSGCLLLLGGNTLVAWSEHIGANGHGLARSSRSSRYGSPSSTGVFLRSAPLGWRVVVGLVMGFAGAALLVGGSRLRCDAIALAGLLLAVGASL